jgi:hypothetical protein
MHAKPIKVLSASLCVAVLVSACAMPEISAPPVAPVEQTTMSECPTPTPQSIGMIETVEDGIGAAVLPAASPAEAVGGEVVELTAQQVLSRELMLERVNAGPGRSRDAEASGEPPSPGAETLVVGDSSTGPVTGEATPTPCP